MTIASTSDTKPADGPIPSDAGYIGWLLAARERPAERSALRRGGIEATSDRAYPYLVRFWQNALWLKQPMLLHASAAATFPRIRHTPNASFGKLAKALGIQGIISADTIGTRLLATQAMSLANAHRLLSGLLHAADGHGVTLDWSSVWDLYRGWEHPNRQIRLRTRRRLLEQFYS